MFDFLKEVSDTYTWPVTARIPVSGGKPAEIKFQAEFRRLDSTEIEEIRIKYVKAVRNRSENILSDSDSYWDKDVVNDVLAGIQAKDNTGKWDTVPDDLIDKLRAVAGVDGAITNAFFTSLKGERAKN